MSFHTARFATEKQVRPPACRKCFFVGKQSSGQIMLKLDPAYATEVYESESGYFVIAQPDDFDDSRVVLTREQAAIVGEELLRLAKQPEVETNTVGFNHA